MRNSLIDAKMDNEQSALGVVLTVVQVAVFFTFVYLCSFHAPLLRTDVFGIGIPLSFLTGLLVIVCGVALTALYVIVANSSSGK